MSLPYDQANDALRVNVVSSTAGGGGDGAILDGVSSAIKATVTDLTNSNPLAVAIVDGAGSQITSFGGGTQYTEGDVDATITGTAMLWEDAANVLTPVNTSKPLPVGDAGGSLTVDAANLDVALSTRLKPADTLTAVTTVGTITNVVHVDDNASSLTVDGTGTFTTKETRAGTGTTTSVASSASNVTLLGSNASRLGVTIFNDSTASLFVKLGATATSSSFAVKMAAGSYYEVPYNYTGIIDGIWDSANGNARLTELT